jgi:ParB-like chromosome segregation protein Spo0J
VIKLAVQTYGKKDNIGFLPADLLANLPAFTGRKKRTPQQIQKMVDSLLKEGQIQDVVYRISFDRKPVLVAGVTRAMAGDRINKEGLTDAKGNTYTEANPFILTGRCKSFKQDRSGELDALCMTWFENAEDTRTPLNDVDVSAFIEVLSENYGLTDAQIAERLRQEVSWVISRKRVATLDTATQTALAAGSISFDAAMVAGEIDPAVRSAAFAKAAAAVGDGKKVTASALAEAARDLGAATGKPLRRTEKQVKDWMKAKAKEAPESCATDFLLALFDYRQGTNTTEDLDAAFAALLPSNGPNLCRC